MVKRTSKKPPAPIPMVKDYLLALRQQLVWLIILPGIFITLTVALILVSTETLEIDSPTVWIISLLIGVLSSGGSLLVFVIVSSPVNDILRVIAHVSGEPLDGPVPNPHDEKYTKSGLGTAIQTIYTLDRSRIERPDADQPVAPVDRMHGSLMALDASHKITYASEDAPIETINGETQPQLLFSGEDTLEAWIEECEKQAVKAENFWRRIPNKTAGSKDQRLFDVHASYEKGATYETVLTIVDMTNIYKPDEDDLNFIALAAHELRGPITVIRGYLEVLQDELAETLSADQHELFHRLTVSSNRLSDYINNILNTARYDRRHLNLNLIESNLADIYGSISDDMNLRASTQNRQLAVSIPTDLPKVAADQTSLSEVMSNLIDNAIKYSHNGGQINISGHQEDDYVIITVADEGIGMPSTIVKNLFQKFYRSHRSRESVGGTGIGLYISKAIIESHGGTVTVHSEEGKGSTFAVAIPTYASVKDKLGKDGSNQSIVSRGNGWIKNHSMYRG